MSKRLIMLLAALLVLGFAYSGCGGDDESSDSSSTVTDTVTDVDTVTDDEVVTDTETVTDTTETTATSEGGGAVAPDVQQAIASCKKAVTAYPQLSGDTKADLEQLCEKAGSGNAEDAREAGREVCRKIVGDLYPSGVPGKSAALKACESSVQ